MKAGWDYNQHSRHREMSRASENEGAASIAPVSAPVSAMDKRQTPSVLWLPGVSRAKCQLPEDIHDARMVEAAGDEEMRRAGAQDPFDKIPATFTGMATWPESTNLHCWACGFTFDNAPAFVATYVSETEKGVEMGVRGVMCTFNCAERWIEDEYHGDPVTLWRMQENLILAYFLTTGILPKKIEAAPRRNNLMQYGGSWTPDEFWERLRALDRRHGLRDHTPNSVISERERMGVVAGILAAHKRPAGVRPANSHAGGLWDLYFKSSAVDSEPLDYVELRDGVPFDGAALASGGAALVSGGAPGGAAGEPDAEPSSAEPAGGEPAGDGPADEICAADNLGGFAEADEAENPDDEMRERLDSDSAESDLEDVPETLVKVRGQRKASQKTTTIPGRISARPAAAMELSDYHGDILDMALAADCDSEPGVRLAELRELVRQLRDAAVPVYLYERAAFSDVDVCRGLTG